MQTEPANQPPARPDWLHFRLGYLVILAVVILFSVKFAQQTWENHQRGVQLAAMQAQYADQEAYSASLRRNISRYKTLAFVKQQARSWGYVTPGDRPVLISYQHIGLSHGAGHRNRASTTANPDWQQWWDAFFGGSGR